MPKAKFSQLHSIKNSQEGNTQTFAGKLKGPMKERIHDQLIILQIPGSQPNRLKIKTSTLNCTYQKRSEIDAVPNMRILCSYRSSHHYNVGCCVLYYLHFPSSFQGQPYMKNIAIVHSSGIGAWVISPRTCWTGYDFNSCTSQTWRKSSTFESSSSHELGRTPKTKIFMRSDTSSRLKTGVGH